MKISALIVVLLLAACTAFANEIAYHSKNGHFFALIDSSWKESFEIQKEFEDAIKTRREHLATLYFNEVGNYPYLMLKFVKMDRKPTLLDIKKLLTSLKSAKLQSAQSNELNKIIKKAGGDSMVSDFSNNVVLNEKERTVTVRTRIYSAQFDVTMKTVYSFNQKGFLIICYAALSEEYDRYLPESDRFLKSISYEKDYQ
jgi:hypothetical protein